ncbi:hypothetical protein MFLO_06987 [Listeria floridensis FSL S10-1187]|uniref:Uncharacterized protein n=1 Tax=Listeria floridensis FSL S10-1187 TaxID=1265817 RepID=A0ABN0RFU9_9LIST|nr:hypothetical protein [Listeria floridensis]EUJ32445.1 hypothetical protein MFLO_06987 [Listeria floridensis FSL S10-1187]
MEDGDFNVKVTDKSILTKTSNDVIFYAWIQDGKNLIIEDPLSWVNWNKKYLIAKSDQTDDQFYYDLPEKTPLFWIYDFSQDDLSKFETKVAFEKALKEKKDFT